MTLQIADSEKPVPMLRVGQSVRIHPASDWFMRGETDGRVVAGPNKTGSYRVEGNLSGQKWWSSLRYLMDDAGNPYEE